MTGEQAGRGAYEVPALSADECPTGCLQAVREFFIHKGVDVHVTILPPLIETPYEPLGLTCPHGVRLYGEPTSEQQVAWAQEGVR